MVNKYSPERIEEIQLNLIALTGYAQKHTKYIQSMPFKYCEAIIKNIDVCRKNRYSDIEQLSEMIRDNWKMAREVPDCGLADYYIPNRIFKIQSSVNQTLGKQISIIDTLITVVC